VELLAERGEKNSEKRLPALCTSARYRLLNQFLLFHGFSSPVPTPFNPRFTLYFFLLKNKKINK
jgi:hypothetical protein